MKNNESYRKNRHLIKKLLSPKLWRKITSVMLTVTVFLTTYMMILPALTIDLDTVVSEPGMDVATADGNPDMPAPDDSGGPLPSVGESQIMMDNELPESAEGALSGSSAYFTEELLPDSDIPADVIDTGYTDETMQGNIGITASDNADIYLPSEELEEVSFEDETVPEYVVAENEEISDLEVPEDDAGPEMFDDGLLLPEDSGEEPAEAYDEIIEAAEDILPSEDQESVDEGTEPADFVIDNAEAQEDVIEETEDEENNVEESVSPHVLKTEGEDYRVTVSFGDEAEIPEGAELLATEILPDELDYDQYVSEAADALSTEKTIMSVDNARFFDITIINENEVVEPKAPVTVLVELTDSFAAAEDAAVIHYTEDEVKVVETVDPEEAAASIEDELSGMEEEYSFEAESVEYVEEVPFAGAEPVEAEEEADEEEIFAEPMNPIAFVTDSFSVYGFVTATIEKTILASDGHNYKVSVTCGADAGIPEDAVLSVEEITQEVPDYDAYVANVENVLGKGEKSVEYVRLFDIKIVDALDASVKYQPAEGSSVDVRIELADTANKDLSVVHFGEADVEGVALVTETNEGEEGSVVEFKTEGFSVFAVAYTVDFHYEVNGKMYEFSIPGGGFVSLEHLVEMLGIAFDDANKENGTENGSGIENEFEGEVPDVDISGENGEVSADETNDIGAGPSTNSMVYEEAIQLNEVEVSDATKKFVADVESVEFSNPELVWVGKIDEETTVGEIKESRGLEIEYSAELTEEQIAEINAQTVEAGDWALISMQPFKSEETLTVTMKNGDQFVVRVTDAYDETNHPLKLHFVDESGQPISGITFAGEPIQTNNGVFTLTADWVRNHVVSNGTESILDLTGFAGPNLYTLSNTHKGTYVDSISGSYPSVIPHTIIGNELRWTNDDTLQYRVFYINNDKAGSEWFDVGSQPKSKSLNWGDNADNYWKYGPHNTDGSYNGNANSSPSDPIWKGSEQDNIYDYYLVYSGVDTSGSSPEQQHLSPEDLDPLGKSKTLTPNEDGTYTMDLSVTTATLPHEEDKGVNVIVLFDTSSSMRRKVGDDSVQYSASEFKSKDDSRFIQAKNALAEILNEVCPANNSTTKELELALIDFNYKANDHKFSNNTYWTTGPTEFMNTVGTLSCPSGTNWADALKMARTIKATADDDPTYVVLMTDGAPSQYWSVDNYFVSGECGYLGARDDARAVVNDGMELYSVFSYGTQKDKDNQYLTKLVDYSYNKTMNGHAFYADSTGDLKAALKSIFGSIGEIMGHTNVNYYDGIALDTTSTALKINTGGSLGSITYSKIGGTSPNYTVSTNADGTIRSFTVGGAPDPATGSWSGGTSYPNGTTTNITYKKISGGTPSEGEETSPISTADVTSSVYQCTVESGENAGTYNMPIATLVQRDTNGDGKNDVGDLNWDLSPLGMLEDGATYKISFVVWPEQEAYDYVADLNNGKKEWNSETQIAYPEGAAEEEVQYYKNGVEQYPNIVYNPTTKLYEVLTNTSQEVTYYIEDRVTGSSESYFGIYTVIPEQPAPMPLTATQSDIEKAWGVDRNPSTLAQLLYDKEGHSKHFTIDYAIMREDSDDPYMTMTLGWDEQQNKYIWEPDSVQTVYLNNNEVEVPVEVGTRWSEDFAITTGLMLSEAQMDAHGLDKNAYMHYSYDSTKYYILEPGYDYTIKEIYPEYAESWVTYEFDFISPVYHPMLVDGKLKNVTFVQQQGVITGISDISRDDWLASLKIENNLRGYINLEKIVVDRDGSTIREDDETKFTYHISLENYYTNPGPFRGDSIPWYGVNGLYYHDADFNYYQAETHTDNNKAYSFELKAEDGTVYQAHCTDPEGIFDEDIPGPTPVTYTKGEGEDSEEISILLYGNEMNLTDANNVWADLMISQKEKLSVANVPAGTKYTIYEAQQDGYDVMSITKEVRKKDSSLEDSSSLSGRDTITDVIVPDRENDIIFKNRVRSIDVSFDKVDGNGKPLSGATFTMYSDETCQTIAKDALGEDLVAISKYDGKVCFGEMVAGTYYMKETETPEGYVPDETVYTVMVTQEGQTKHAVITTPAGTETTEIVNSKEEITLAVEKTWLDADGNEIVNPEYSATFTAHRNRTYTTTEMQEAEPDGYATLKIGYYYNWYNQNRFSLFEGQSYDFGAGQTVDISYSYNNNNQRGYIINQNGQPQTLTQNNGTVTVTMPSAGQTVTVYFYDQPDYWGNNHITINSVQSVHSQVPVEVPHEDEEDLSFHPTLTLTGGVLSGSFEGTYPVEETKEGVTYHYTYYITEDPMEDFITTSDGGSSDGSDLSVHFVNRKKPHPHPVDVDVEEEAVHHKELTENYVDGKWDGTYTLSLDVTGKAASTETSDSDKVDVILVLDMSSSMSNIVSGTDTRFDVEIESVRGFATELLNMNKTAPDTVRLSALTFGNVANVPPLIVGETSGELFNQALSGLTCPPPETAGLAGGGQGTNWEDALKEANAIPTRSDADKIVIFVSDGLPTLRNTRGPYDTNQEWSGATFEGLYHSNSQGTGFLNHGYDVWGFGTDHSPSDGPLAGFGNVEALQGWLDFAVQQCYDNAKDEARAIYTSGKEFYTISVFESVPRMEQLVAYAYSESNSGSYPAGHYKTANNAGDLSSIFSDLVRTASKAVDFRNVKISDPLTAATKTIASVDGTPVDFKYWKVTVDGEGNETAVEWTGGPKATYVGSGTGGSIEWDVSAQEENGVALEDSEDFDKGRLKDGALENDVTYRVTFTVWPNQDAYDAVLKLNEAGNDHAKISRIFEEYSDIADQIIKDPQTGIYRIYSNGDATLKYTQYTSINGGDPQPGEEQTLYYPRPTMETLEYTMKVKKIWNDSIFPNHRVEKVKFEIKEDGVHYHTVILDSRSQSVRDPNVWEAEIPVSPGIESDQIAEGVKLNEGHVYTVTESFLIDGKWVAQDYHYEFDPESVTPLLLNGVMGYEGDTDGDNALTGINNARGSVTITKKIVDKKGVEITDDLPEDEFSFQITLYAPNGTKITGKTTEDDDAIWYNKFERDGNVVGNAAVINSGDTFKLKAGESLRLINVPIGIGYSVNEVNSSIPEGFEFVSTDYTYKTGSDGTVRQQTAVGSLYKVIANTWHYVTVKNKKNDEPDFSFSKVWLAEDTILDDITADKLKAWAEGNTISVTIRRIADGAQEPDATFSLSYVIDSGTGPFKPRNEGMSEEDKTKYQLTKTVLDKITVFAMEKVPANEDQNGKAYTYYVEESSASGGSMLYNTYYGRISEENVSRTPGAGHAEDGEAIINLEYSGYELPSTGGPGRELFILLGSLLISFAAMIYMYQVMKRRAE